jgi:radical SAM superfamily enzyme YgiQ (UPF0313 family)
MSSLNRKIRVILGDLRHKTVGLHSIYIPLGIGSIASYVLSQFDEGAVEIKLFTDPDETIEAIENWRPHIVGVSNYLWNSNLSNRVCEIAKEFDDAIITVCGGPQFPLLKDERKEYLLSRPDIDFYIYEDGEMAFTELIHKLIEFEFDIKKVRSIKNDGIISVKNDSKKILIGKSIKRFTNMDKIPSPYLAGLFDSFLTKNFMPALETTRGCPYTCAYCHTGNKHKVCQFSAGRIKNELDYIVDNTENLENKGLSLFDDNFGLYKKDKEIAEHIEYIRNKTGWPKSIEVSGIVKRGSSVLIPEYEIYKSKQIGWSFQSLNNETLRVIKRQNPTKERIIEIANKLLEQQNTIPCELIAPLPLETKESYFKTQKFLIENGFNTQTYTPMLLNGTPLTSKKSREKYNFVTKHRVIPRQFGEYKNKKIFEVEEVCVSTNTLSYNDYIDIRGFSLLVRIFTNEQFNIIQKHLEDYNLSFYEYIYEIWDKVKNGNSELAVLYSEFLNEANNELFETDIELYNHFSEKENYEQLLNLKVSDNLIRKYTSKAYFLKWDKLLKFAYSILKKMENFSEDQKESLDAAEKWAFTLRNVTNVFDKQKRDNLKLVLELPYDVLEWYSRSEKKPLHMYKAKTYYNITSGEKYYEMVKFIDELTRQREGDIEFIFGNLITRGWRLSDLWLKCGRLERRTILNSNI